MKGKHRTGWSCCNNSRCQSSSTTRTFFLCISFISICVYPTECGSECLQKCSCVYRDNRLAANCSAIQLTQLPNVSGEKNVLDIQVINLTGNNLMTLKRNTFFSSQLINLQRIYLIQAGLREIEKGAFHRLANLVLLDLSQNYLQAVPSHSFQSIPKLRFLNLEGNQIPSVLPLSFQYLSQLERLDLDRNKIKYVDEKAFVGLRSLSTLRLSGNQLSLLSGTSFLPVIKLHSLTLAKNKWVCDCRLRQFREYLLSNSKLNVEDKPKCQNIEKVWTEMDLPSFLCAPQIWINESSSTEYRVEPTQDMDLECYFSKDNGLENQPLKINWYWKGTVLQNNSEGILEHQHFVMHESDREHTQDGTSRKFRVSRLEIRFILQLNEGVYRCEAANRAGKAGRNFSVVVSRRTDSYSFASLSPLGDFGDGQDGSSEKNENVDGGATSSVLLGLILGILFGIFLVLVLFTIVVILLCRKRGSQKKKRMNGMNPLFNNRVMAAESELEKLTSCTISGSTPSLLPAPMNTLINPIQKPPRLPLLAGNRSPATGGGDNGQMWLMKGNEANNGNGVLRSDGDGCCETPLPLCEYDFNAYSANISTIPLPPPPSLVEPDLIHHPSASVRNNLGESHEEMSIHSDGTEV